MNNGVRTTKGQGQQSQYGRGLKIAAVKIAHDEFKFYSHCLFRYTDSYF